LHISQCMLSMVFIIHLLHILHGHRGLHSTIDGLG